MRVKNYFIKVNQYYPLSRIFICSFMIIVLYLFTDSLDIIKNNLNKLNYIILVFIVIFLIYLFKQGKSILQMLFKMKSINIMDGIILYLFDINILILLTKIIDTKRIFFINRNGFLNIILLISVVIDILVIIYRAFHTNKLQEKKSYEYSLYEFITKEIIDKPFYLSDDTTTDDLMNRKYLIEQLQYYVYRIDYKGSYTISLNGKWGTGKSSIIEKLLNENKDSRIKFIQFDPWKYDDESSMIKGLIARIVNELEIKIVSLELNINRLIDKYINDKQISIFLELLFSNKQLKNEDKIIDLINERIVKDNLKLVVIIDNLDRAENKNIILIYKLISCILNFKNTLYILVYDKEIIKKVFKDKGHDFLDKIVKKSIEIPEFENQRLRIISYKALEKIATFHNVCINEIEELEIVKNEDYFETFRDIIIFINNNLMFYICDNTNFSDFVLIKIIKKNNYQLYMEIEKNKHHILDNKLHNNHLKNILSEIAKSNELGIMKLLFPSLFNETKENNSNQNKRICSPFYFDYYFYGNIEEGDYSIIKKKFIDKMGQNRINNKGILPFIKEYKGNMVSNLVREIISNLSGSDIEYKNQIIKNIISYMEFYVGGNLYDNRIIVQSIAKDLIQIFDSSNFKKIKKIFYRPMNIYITYIFKTELKGFENSKNNIFEKIYTQAINNIIKNKISIYSQKYYRKSNIFAFYKNESIVEEYLKGVLNESNIFIFLEDFIGCFFENGYYKYFINIELLNDYISQEYIYLLIEKSIPLNEDNKFIKNLFLQTYKNRSDELVTIDLLDKRIERFKLSRKDTEK